MDFTVKWRCLPLEFRFLTYLAEYQLVSGVWGISATNEIAVIQSVSLQTAVIFCLHIIEPSSVM